MLPAIHTTTSIEYLSLGNVCGFAHLHEIVLRKDPLARTTRALTIVTVD